MRKFFFLFCLMANLAAFAQPIERAFTFSGSLFDTITGNPINQKQITAQVSVLSASGTLLYRENQPNTATTPILMTNKYGYFDYKVGKGAATFGQFDTLNWATAKKLRTIITVLLTGATITLNNDILPVPTAMYALKANETQQLTLNGNSLSISGGNMVNLPNNTNTSAGIAPISEIINTGTSNYYPYNGSAVTVVASGTNGNIVYISMFDQYYSGILYRMEKDVNGHYFVTHQTQQANPVVTSMAIIGNTVYYCKARYYNNQGYDGAISKGSINDLSDAACTINPPIATFPNNIITIGTDGTNVLINHSNQFNIYNNISTALIDTGQDFVLNTPSGLAFNNPIFDGSNYYATFWDSGTSTNYLGKFDLNKNLISQQSTAVLGFPTGSSLPEFCNYSSTQFFTVKYFQSIATYAIIPSTGGTTTVPTPLLQTKAVNKP